MEDSNDSRREAVDTRERPVTDRRAFLRLREQVYADMQAKLASRQALRPEMTDEERQLGVPLEWIEPQVRDAVRIFNRKGYPTLSSGFGGSGEPEYQVIEGHFFLDEDTGRRLAEMDVTTTTKPWWKWQASERAGRANPATPPEERIVTRVRFRSHKPDLQEIEAKWRTVAGILPDRNSQR